MSTTRPWVQWWPIDILNDPKYLVLSRSARLTYRELLDRLWISGCALKDDVRVLAALVNLTVEEFEADWAEIQNQDDPCFIPHPDQAGKITNKRMYREWLKAEEVAEYARQNGKMGGRPKKQLAKNKEQKTDPVMPGLAKQNPDESYPHPQSQSQEEEHPSPSAQDVCAAPCPGDRSTPPPAISMPINPQGKGNQDEEPISEAEVAEWVATYGNIDVRQVLQHMRQYWLARPKSERKTRRGIRKSITTWLAKDNDRARASPASGGPLSQLSPKGQRTAMNATRVLERMRQQEGKANDDTVF